MQFIGQFVLKVSRPCVVRGERGVIFLFSAKRPPRKGELFSHLRRAGQRRCFQRVFLAFSYRGRPSLRSGNRSLQKNHSPFAPSYGLGKRRELVALVTRTSMYLVLANTPQPHDTDETFDREQFIPTKLRFRQLSRTRSPVTKTSMYLSLVATKMTIDKDIA